MSVAATKKNAFDILMAARVPGAFEMPPLPLAAQDDEEESYKHGLSWDQYNFLQDKYDDVVNAAMERIHDVDRKAFVFLGLCSSARTAQRWRLVWWKDPPKT